VEIFEEQRWVIERGDMGRLLALDRRFHAMIYALAGMPRSLEVSEHLRTLSDRYIAMFLADLEGAKGSLREHEAMIEALRIGDVEGMEYVTRIHIRGGIDALNHLIPELSRQVADRVRPHSDADGPDPDERPHDEPQHHEG